MGIAFANVNGEQEQSCDGGTTVFYADRQGRRVRLGAEGKAIDL